MPPKSISTAPLHRHLVVEYVALDELIHDPLNARVHKPAQIKQIGRSIEAFAFNAPILVDGQNKILAGHGRALACRQLGWNEVPVIRLAHLTSEQARAYAIADNRLVETSAWDEAKLAGHLKILAGIDLDFDVEATGFTMPVIDMMIAGLDDAADDKVDDLPVTAGPAVACYGDLWRLGRHTLLCGDALDPASYVQLMGDDRAAMVLTDPPYNQRIDGHVSGKGKIRHREFAMAAGEMSEAEFIAFLIQVCTLMAKASRDGALQFIFMDWAHLFALLTAGRSVYDALLNICVWSKHGGMGGLYRSAHELVAVFKHGRARHRNNVELGRHGRNRTNVWNYAGPNGFAGSGEDKDLTRWHPTPKPIQLLADAILDVTARRDIVLDPFLGSGSTLIAAERVGRVCRGLEMDPLYVDLSIRRWQRLTGAQAVRGDGATFAVLEADAGANGNTNVIANTADDANTSPQAKS
jgi:DNA modification methylase